MKKRVMLKAKWSLLALLVLAVLSACTGNNNKKNEASPSASSPSPSASAAAPESSAPAVEELPIVDISTMLYRFDLDNTSGIDNDRIRKYIEEKLRINLTYKSGTQDDYYTKIETTMATGDAADLVQYNKYFKENLTNWAKEDMIIDIGKLVRENPERYPALDIAFRTNKYAPFYNESVLGSADNTHVFYSMHNSPRAFGGYIFNAAYLNALGLQVPTTTDELIAVLRAIKDGDPDGNGKKDTIPLSIQTNKGVNVTTSFAPFFSTNDTRAGGGSIPFFQDKSGTWQDGTITEATKAVWKQLAGLYKEGLIDREILTNDPATKLMDDFVAGKTAVIETWAPLSYKTVFDKWKERFPDATTADVVMNAEPLKGPTGYAQDSDVSVGTDFIVMIPSSAKHPDRVLDLLNFIISDEGQNLLWYGIEGVHHTKDASGNMQLNADEFRKETMVYLPDLPDRLQYLPFALVTNDWQNYMQIEKEGDYIQALDNSVNLIESRYGANPAAEHQTEVHKKFLELGYTELPPYYGFVNISEEAQAIKTKLDEIRLVWTTKFLVGQKDVDKDWDAYMSEYKAAGADKLKEEWLKGLETQKAKFEAIK